MAPTPGLYETNSYFITQAGLPLANRQRRTTRAQQVFFLFIPVSLEPSNGL